MQEVQGSADHSRKTVPPRGGAPTQAAGGPAGCGDFLQGGAQAGWGATVGGGPGGLILQGAPRRAGPTPPSQVLPAGSKTPLPPALLIQGQCSLQPGPRRRLRCEGSCLGMWILIGDLCWDVRREHWALLRCLPAVRQGPRVGDGVFLSVWELPLEHPDFRLQMPLGGGLLGGSLRVPHTRQLRWHSPGASPHGRQQLSRLRRWLLLGLLATPSVRGAKSDVAG